MQPSSQEPQATRKATDQDRRLAPEATARGTYGKSLCPFSEKKTFIAVHSCTLVLQVVTRVD